MTTKYEPNTKTYQYRKVMKPLLERKRRARINECLDDLKELLVECMQLQSGDPTVKLDKVDILELTAQYMRKLKVEKQRQKTHIIGGIQQSSFRGGYIKAANEVSRCLASLPNVDVSFGTQLMTHLGLRLNQLESAKEVHTTVHKPLSISVSANYNTLPRDTALTHLITPTTPASMYSPVSSGYASDSDASRSSPAPSCSNQTLLHVASPVWRPW